MTERVTQTFCEQITHIGEAAMPNARTFLIKLDGRPYEVTVTTSDYLGRLRAYNQTLAPEARLDDNMFVLPNISGPEEEICEKLSKIPFEQLEPYLTPFNSG